MKYEPASYVLVTPVRNESKMLAGLFESVLNQTAKPAMWIFVDDCSTDDTRDKIHDMAFGHNWIVSEKKEETGIPSWTRYGRAIDYGIKRSVELFDDTIHYPKLIGVLDADTILNERYFEETTRALSESPNGVIATGLISVEGGAARDSSPQPRGCARLYKRTFLDEVGGFRLGLAPDSILEIKAANRKYELIVCPEAKGVHRRGPSELSDISSFKVRGKVQYLLGMDTVTMLAMACLFSYSYGVRKSMNFVAGYLGGIKGENLQVEDPEIRQYYSKAWQRFFRKKESRLGVKSLLRI